MKSINTITFSRTNGQEFTRVLNKRVRAYFKESSKSMYANTNMKIKTIFMTSLYIVPLSFLLSGLVQEIWLTGIMYLLMGFGTAGIGLCIMHDANHGAYSKKRRVNNFMGNLVNLIGGYAPTWRMQHNILHHTYTNIHNYDEDIQPPRFLRFSPNEKHLNIHKYQHLFAWFFYGLMTFSWITLKDFNQLYRYRNLGIIKTEKDSFRKLLYTLYFVKFFYYLTVIILPILIIDIPWYWIPIFVFVLHFVAGTILAHVFQTAHVVSETDFVEVGDEKHIDEAFAIHQMRTTANFAPKSRVFSWLIGGLNYQIEHHLFPNICHVHYKEISKIVRKTAQEYNVPYNSYPTFFSAVASHLKMLRLMGNPASQKSNRS